MTLHGGLAWINVSQFVVAGLAAMLAAEQAAVWRWEGVHSSARRVSATAAACAGLLLSNGAMMLVSDDSSRSELYLLRALAVAAMSLSLLPLASGLSATGRPGC